MLEETAGGRCESRECSKEVAAVGTGGDGSWTRVVAAEGGRDLKAQLTAFAEGREVAGRQRSRGLRASGLSWHRTKLHP